MKVVSKASPAETSTVSTLFKAGDHPTPAIAAMPNK
jgi:hypothetical protein